MFGLSPLHLVLVLIIVLVLFGGGKLSQTMGDFGKGVREFRKGMKEDDDDHERNMASKHPEIAPPSKVTIDSEEKTTETKD
jgi:sec-independent protein translocase protein TatA